MFVPRAIFAAVLLMGSMSGSSCEDEDPANDSECIFGCEGECGRCQDLCDEGYYDCLDGCFNCEGECAEERADCEDDC